MEKKNKKEMSERLECLINEAKGLNLNIENIISIKSYSEEEKIKILENRINFFKVVKNSKEQLKKTTKEIETKLELLKKLLDEAKIYDKEVKSIEALYNANLSIYLCKVNLKTTDAMIQKLEQLSLRIDKKIEILKTTNDATKYFSLNSTQLKNDDSIKDISIQNKKSINNSNKEKKEQTSDVLKQIEDLKKIIRNKLTHLDKIMTDYEISKCDLERLERELLYVSSNFTRSPNRALKKLELISWEIDEKMIVVRKIKKIYDDFNFTNEKSYKLIPKCEANVELVLEKTKENVAYYKELAIFNEQLKLLLNKIKTLTAMLKNFNLIDYDNNKIIEDCALLKPTPKSIKDAKWKLKEISKIVETQYKRAKIIESSRVELIKRIESYNLKDSNIYLQQLSKILLEQKYSSFDNLLLELHLLSIDIDKDYRLSKEKEKFKNKIRLIQNKDKTLQNVYNSIDCVFLKNVYKNMKFENGKLLISNEICELFKILKKHGRKDNVPYSDEEIIKFITNKCNVIISDYNFDYSPVEITGYNSIDMDKMTKSITGKHRN